MPYSYSVALLFFISAGLSFAENQVQPPVPLSKLPHAVDIQNMQVKQNTKEISLQSTGTREAVITAPKKEDQKNNELPEPVSHEAEYDVSFVADNDPDYQGAVGKMVMQLKRFEKDWVMEQTTTLKADDGEGGKETTISKFTTYENHEGNAYEFNARAVRTSKDDAAQPDLVDFAEGEIEEDISGRGRLVAKDGAGTVIYEKPEEKTIDLPVGTIFPMTHLKMLLAKAFSIKGKNIELLKAKVFDGSSDVQEAVRIEAVIAPVDAKKKVVVSSDTSIYKPEKLWRIEMVVYTVENKSHEPDYKIIQVISNLGVIHEIIIDYDGYKMKAELQKLKIYHGDEAARSIKINDLPVKVSINNTDSNLAAAA